MEEAHTPALPRCPPWGRLQGGVTGSLLSRPSCHMLYLHLDLGSRDNTRSYHPLSSHSGGTKGPPQRVVRLFLATQPWVRWHIPPPMAPCPTGAPRALSTSLFYCLHSPTCPWPFSSLPAHYSLPLCSTPATAASSCCRSAVNSGTPSSGLLN